MEGTYGAQRNDDLDFQEAKPTQHRLGQPRQFPEDL